MRQEQLVVFVKAPRIGTVKTRLAKSIGAAAALNAYRCLVETLLGNLESLPEVELRFSPDDAFSEIQPWLRDGWRIQPQGNGDLGGRLQRALGENFSVGAKRVVIIGSDCPSVNVSDVRAAWSALASHDAVLGPARDGGYWLIGLNASQPLLFENIPWSTDAVLRETLARAKSTGLRVHHLRELSDVDTEADWKEFLRQRTGAISS